MQHKIWIVSYVVKTVINYGQPKLFRSTKIPTNITKTNDTSERRGSGDDGLGSKPTMNEWHATNFAKARSMFERNSNNNNINEKENVATPTKPSKKEERRERYRKKLQKENQLKQQRAHRQGARRKEKKAIRCLQEAKKNYRHKGKKWIAKPLDVLKVQKSYQNEKKLKPKRARSKYVCYKSRGGSSYSNKFMLICLFISAVMIDSTSAAGHN